MSTTFEKLFGFDSRKHNVRTEIMAGITTFLTMAYILAVNPAIFSALPGMPSGSVFTATTLAAIIGTLVMAFYAKKPFALAPGMGLNAFFVYTAGLVMAKVRGGILWGILITTLVGLVIKDPSTGESITKLNGLVSVPDSVGPISFKFEWEHVLSVDMVVVIFTFLFIDMFDTMGTLIGVHQSIGMADPKAKQDEVPDMDKMFMADSVATVCGACLGTSTTTTYVESASGIGEGGRTGLTAFSTAVCFAMALFFSPLFLAIPSAATAPALIIVGVMMMPAVKRIHWEDYCRAIPAFLTIILMPLAYSISDGILVGVIAYVGCHAVAGKFRLISITMWVLAILFVCKYIFI